MSVSCAFSGFLSEVTEEDLRVELVTTVYGYLRYVRAKDGS